MPFLRNGGASIVLSILGATACGGKEVGSAAGAFHDSGATGSPFDSGAGGAAEYADGGPPPDYCVPPCVWRAIAACTPPAAHECHEVPSDAGTSGVTCDPASGWFHTRTDGSSAGITDAFGHSGVVCFTIRYGGKAPAGARVVTDGINTIATYGTIPMVVHCPDDQKDYSIDLTRPECAPWVSGGSVQPKLACESTVPGSCDMVP